MTSESEPNIRFRRVLLVGFMGAGKSSVGDHLARQLGWRFRDFDHEVERRIGLPVHRIFEDYGEDVFRTQEERIAVELLGADRMVLASGGGWPCRRGRMEGLSPSTLSVWLRVSPEIAVERCRESATVRPLLETGDPVAAATALLEERRVYYEQADWSLDSTTGDPEFLAERLARQMRTDPERPIRE